jgi:hypothetical protein
MRTTDAAAHLMQLRQTELVGAINDDGVGGGYVDATFHNGGADKEIAALVAEIQHHLFQLAFAHLAMTDGDVGFRDEFTQRSRGLINRLDAVVYVVNLATATDLAQTGFTHCGAIEWRDKGLDGKATGRGRGDQRQVAQATHGHVERARNRRGGEVSTSTSARSCLSFSLSLTRSDVLRQ